MIADVSFEGELKNGDTFHRTYRSSNRPRRYVRGSDIDIKDKTDTDETLVVDQEFATGFYVDDFDEVQNNYDAAANYGKDDGVYLSNEADASILGEVLNAASANVVDASLVGGTAGEGLSISTSNVLAVFSAAKKLLRKQNVPIEEGLYAVCSAELEEVLIQYGAGRDTSQGDQAVMNGFFGKFYGFQLYSSNQLTGTAVLALATQPTNGDTITIQGVDFTFVSSIGSTAGNVLIGGNVDETRGHLAALLNNPATTNGDQVALTGDDLALFDNNGSAVNDDTGNTLTVTLKGVGVLEVSSNLTDGTDGWTAAKQIQHNVFGVRGGMAYIAQKTPRLSFKDEPKRHGGNILNGILYGTKMFNDGKKMTVDVKLRSDSF